MAVAVAVADGDEEDGDDESGDETADDDADDIRSSWKADDGDDTADDRNGLSPTRIDGNDGADGCCKTEAEYEAAVTLVHIASLVDDGRGGSANSSEPDG